MGVAQHRIDIGHRRCGAAFGEGRDEIGTSGTGTVVGVQIHGRRRAVGISADFDIVELGAAGQTQQGA